MNICLVSQEYPPETPWGGIGFQTWIKAKSLTKRGHQVVVLSRVCDADKQVGMRCDQEGDVLVYRMQPPGDEFPLFERQTYMLAYTFYVLKSLDELRKRHKFDVIDFAEYAGEGYAYQLDRTLWNWIPVVVQMHGPMAMFIEYFGWPDPDSRMAALGTTLEKFSLERADARMSCSLSVARLAQKYYGIPADSVDVVHCGVDAELFRMRQHGERQDPRPTVLFVGNVVENKGAHILIDAALQLVSKIPDVRVLFFGRGREKFIEHYRAKARERGVEQMLEFMGSVDQRELPYWYRQADVFCSPSEYEGFGQVYLEAMGSGCPVVASTAGGATEAVIDGETGLLVPPNDVAATANALDRILGDKPLAERMGLAGRRRVDEYFAMDHYVDRVLATYQRAIENSKINLARLKTERGLPPDWEPSP